MQIKCLFFPLYIDDSSTTISTVSCYNAAVQANSTCCILLPSPYSVLQLRVYKACVILSCCAALQLTHTHMLEHTYYYYVLLVPLFQWGKRYLVLRQ